jgi:UDP-N-acetylmuramoylalanine--D-glutamate ligase
MRVADQEVRGASVLGYGRTGRAVTAALLARGVRVFVSEGGRLSPGDREELEARGVGCEAEGHTARILTQADLVVPSPGVPSSLPVLVEARRRGIRTLSELDLAYLLLPVPSRIVGVTGTKGKGTTTELIAALLRRSEVDAVVAGNIGIPAVSVIDSVRPECVLVLELSSFQLEQSQFFHPQVAVLTNLSPDHVERHPTWDAYVAAKGRLFWHLTEEDTAVLPRDLEPLFPGLRARRVFFDRLALPPLAFVDRLAPHNRANLKAAIAACSALFPGFDSSTIQGEEIQGALSLPFRLQEEGTLGGVRVVNDSKSTNAASTVAALESFVEPVVLVLGGRHKSSGYERLARAVATRAVRRAILYGEAAAFLRGVLAQEGYTQAQIFRDLGEAVGAAVDAGLPGDVLLFSPACSSFDQFANAHERGEAFSQLVRAYPSFRAARVRA